MGNIVVKKGAKLNYAIIDEDVTIGEHAIIGAPREEAELTMFESAKSTRRYLPPYGIEPTVLAFVNSGTFSSKVIEYHVQKNADITLVYHEHEVKKTHYYMTFDTDNEGKITGPVVTNNRTFITYNVSYITVFADNIVSH